MILNRLNEWIQDSAGTVVSTIQNAWEGDSGVLPETAEAWVQAPLGIARGLNNVKALFTPWAVAADVVRWGERGNTFDNINDVGEFLLERGQKRFGDAAMDLFSADSGIGAAIKGTPEHMRAPHRTWIEPAMEGMEWAGTELIHEPLTTALLAGNLDIHDLYMGKLWDGQTWKDAHALAQVTSLGEAITFGLTNTDPLDLAAQQRLEANPWFHITSGSIDFFKQWFLDGDILVAGAFDVAKTAKLAKNTKAKRASHYSEGGGFDKIIDLAETTRAEEVRKVSIKNVEETQQKLTHTIDKAKELDDFLTNLISEDVTSAQFILDARTHDLSSAEIHDLAQRAQDHIKNGFDYETLPDADKKFLDGALRQWLGSSTNTTMHQALTLRRVTEGARDAGGQVIYRGHRISQAGWREPLGAQRAAERGGDVINRPHDELRPGDEIDFGLQSFSLRPEKAKDFGTDAMYIIEETEDANAWRIPDRLDQQAGYGEQELLVTGHFEVTRIERPGDITPAVRQPTEDEMYSLGYWHEDVMETFDHRIGDLRLWFQEAFPPGSEARAALEGLDQSEVTAKFKEWAQLNGLDVQSPSSGIFPKASFQEGPGLEGTFTLEITPNGEPVIMISELVDDIPKIYLKPKGNVETNFSPKNVDEIHQKERQLKQLQEEADDLGKQLAAVDVDSREGLVRQLEEDSDKLWKRIKEMEHESFKMRQEASQAELPFGARLFRNEEGSFDPTQIQNATLTELNNFDQRIFQIHEELKAKKHIWEDADLTPETLEGLEPLFPLIDAVKDLRADVAERIWRIRQRATKASQANVPEGAIGNLVDYDAPLTDLITPEDIDSFRQLSATLWEIAELSARNDGLSDAYKLINDKFDEVLRTDLEDVLDQYAAGDLTVSEVKNKLHTLVQVASGESIVDIRAHLGQLPGFFPKLNDFLRGGIGRKHDQDDIFTFLKQDYPYSKALEGLEGEMSAVINDMAITIERKQLEVLRETQRKLRDQHHRDVYVARPQVAERIYNSTTLKHHPDGRRHATLLAMAPDRQTMRWIGRTLAGDAKAINELESAIQKLEEAQQHFDALTREVGPTQTRESRKVGHVAGEEGSILDEGGQLAMDLDVGRMERIAAIHQELMEMRGLHGETRRFLSVWDKEFADHLFRVETTDPAKVKAIANDVGRQLGILQELKQASGWGHEYLPQKLMLDPLWEKARKAGNSVRQSELYRTSPFAGKALRVFMAPFDKRAFPWVSVHDLNELRENSRYMLRQAGFSDAEQVAWVERIAAPGLSESERVRLFEEANDAALHKVLTDYGVPDSEAKKVIEAAQDGRKGAKHTMEKMRFGTEDPDRPGFARDMWPDEDGVNVLVRPLVETQLANTVHVADYTQLRRDLERYQSKGLLPQGDEWQSFSNAARETLDTLNGYQKMSLLLRPAWGPRVIMLDEGLRPMVVFGEVAYAKKLPANLARLRARYVESWDNTLESVGLGNFGKKAVSLGSRALIGGALAGPIGAGVGVATGLAKGNLPQKLSLLRNMGYSDKVKTDVGTFQFDNWRDSSAGEMMAKSLQGRQSLAKLLADGGNVRAALMDATGGWKTMAWNDPAHLNSWHHVLTHQFGQSELVKQAINKNADEWVAWLETSGANLVRDMNVQKADPYDWYDRIVGEVDNLTGGIDELKQALANGEGISKKRLAELFPVEAQRPNINGPEIAYLTGGGIGKWLDMAIDKMVDHFVGMPSDELVRFPTMDLAYHRALRNMIERDAEQGVFQVGPDGDVYIPPKKIKEYEAKARNESYQVAKNLMYEFAAKSEFHRMLRFISPFFAAMEDAWRTWAGLAYEHPVRVVRLSKAYSSIKDLPNYIEDDNGEGWIYWTVPESVSDLLEAGIFGRIEAVGVPRRSMNMIASGDLGIGPWGRIAVSEVVKKKPELADELDWAIGYGVTEDLFDGLAGSLFRNARTMWKKQDDDRYASAYARVLQQEQVKLAQGKLPFNTKTEKGREEFFNYVEDKTNELFRFRMVVTAFSALPVIPQSPYQPFIEYAKGLKEEDPENWFETFTDEFGDEYASVALGITKTYNGVAPTQFGITQYEKHKTLIDQFPEWGSFIVGKAPENDAATEYSDAVYEWQQRTPAYAGANEMMREMKSPAELLDEPEVRLGWKHYIRSMDAIDMELANRGLWSYNQKGAEDLSELRSEVVDIVKRRYPAWWDEFSMTDRDSWNKTYNAAIGIVSNDDLRGRADVQAIEKYLNVRSKWLKMAEERGAAKSLVSGANIDLYTGFLREIQELIVTDPAFAPVYYRRFENVDPLTVGS